MSDDLVKRLREDQPVTQDMESTLQCALQDEAADRIEAMRAEMLELRADKEAAEAKLAKVVELLGQWRIAAAGYVSVQSVVNKHDDFLAELGEGEG